MFQPDGPKNSLPAELRVCGRCRVVRRAPKSAAQLRAALQRWQAEPGTPGRLQPKPRDGPREEPKREDTQICRATLFLPGYIAAYACAAPLVAWAGTGAPDTQLWTELDVTGPLTTNTTITGVARARFSESLPNPILLSPGVDLNYKAGAWTLSAGYRYDATAQREPETVEGKTVKISQVALVMGTYVWRFGSNTLAFRLRLDDTINASSNPYRVRFRVEYRRAVEGVSWMSYLYTNDEVFYELQDQKFFRNRFQAGANLVLTERTDLKVFYVRQDSNNSTPGAINGLGLTAGVTFK